MLIDPRLFVFSSMVIRPYSFHSCCFTDVISALTFLTFLVRTVTSVDKIAKMFLINFIFDVEIPRQLGSSLYHTAFDVFWKVLLECVYLFIHNGLLK